MHVIQEEDTYTTTWTWANMQAMWRAVMPLLMKSPSFLSFALYMYMCMRVYVYMFSVEHGSLKVQKGRYLVDSSESFKIKNKKNKNFNLVDSSEST